MPYNSIEKKRAHNKEKRSKARNYIQELKKQPCIDCGKAYPDFPGVMEFDHVRGSKSDELNALITQRAGLNRIKREVEKCDLVCCLCHRIRTELRRMAAKKIKCKK